ncbi:hypothetical protein D3C72_1379350 [compost metagenome]
MQAVDLVDRKALEQAVVHHGPGAAAVFFGGLEDEAHGAVEIAPLAQQLRGAEHHRHVAVVAAGVHAPGRGGGVGPLGRQLGDGQRVHLGAQADHARPAAHREAGDQPGAADAGVHLEPQRPQRAGNEGRGLRLLEAGLGHRMQLVPPAGQLVAQGCVWKLHGEMLLTTQRDRCAK